MVFQTGTIYIRMYVGQARSKQNFIGQAEIPSSDYNRTMRDEVYQKISTCDQNPQQSY